MNRSNMVDFEHCVYMTYDDWEGLNVSRRKNYLKKMQEERVKRALYYKRQRVFGFLILLVAIVILVIGVLLSKQFLQGVSIVITLIGFYIMLTRQMIFIDEYYLECMDKINFN